MDKIGGIRSFQATDISQTSKKDDKVDTSAVINQGAETLDETSETTSNSLNITKDDVKQYLALKMALNLTEEVGGAVNTALATIKSDGEPSDDSDQVQSSTNSSVNFLSKMLKGQKIKDRLDGMSNTANNLDPSNTHKFAAQLEQLSAANVENQKDLSAHIVDTLKQSNTEGLKQLIGGLKDLIQPLDEMLP